MSKDADTKLGHDPLEWLQDDEEEVTSDEPRENPAQNSYSSETSSPNDICEVETSEPQGKTAEQVSTVESSVSRDINLTLPEKLGVQVVEALHEEWQGILSSKPATVVIDAKLLIDADAAGVQLLYVFLHQLGHQGSEITLTNVSEHINKIFGFAGLTAFFDQYNDEA